MSVVKELLTVIIIAQIPMDHMLVVVTVAMNLTVITLLAVVS